MRSEVNLNTLIATLFLGFTLVAAVFLAAGPAAALSDKQPRGLNGEDRLAALETVSFTLNEVADGASYVWRRGHGKLSGVFQPTMSFVDAQGRVCRHIVVLLNASEKTKRLEAVACRLENGVWRFDS